ncbi:MAG: YesL family protein [Lachnospiraceae bacterium]|nr:YesL family protein [Lachnospiraceae bacterium]
MGGLFSADSIIGKTLTKIGELVILSILWFFTSLPVITIGASTTALYYSMTKCVRRGRGYFVKEYFKAWKRNFVKATFLTLFFLICLLGLWTVLNSLGFTLEDISLNGIESAYKDNASSAMGTYYAAGAYLLILGALFCYVFPVLSRFDLKLINIIFLSFVMMIRFLHYSISVLVILVALACLVMRLPLFIMFAPGLWVLLSSFLLEKAIRKYTPEPEEGEDAWWMEL